MSDSRRIGEILEADGVLSVKELKTALALQSEVGGLLGLLLVRIGAVSETQLLSALSRQLGVPVATVNELPEADQVSTFLTEDGSRAEWWEARQAIAWRDGERVLCASVDPMDVAVRERVERHDDQARFYLAPRALISGLQDQLSVDRVIPAALGGGQDADRLRELAQETPVVEYVNALFAEALSRRASDLHIEPFQDEFLVRMRVDGVLAQVKTGARDSFDAVCSRIKLLSGMDIGERRLPQDGRQSIRVSGRDIDLRVSSLPSSWGESLVVRLLGKSAELPELGAMGLPSEQAERLLGMMAEPNGVVLVTGPTGSGKTTTIYRLLTEMNDGRRKIVTVEDPVEFELPGVVQVNVRSEIGLSFAVGLRSILRQDPDVILVGEIRDSETARTAVQAALTGHLVISTVHTNSALAAPSRLLDLGVEDFLLADVVRGLVGQRLVRKLCMHCATRSDARRREAYLAARPGGVEFGDDWKEPVGCPRCRGTGYLGRVGLFELAGATPALQSAIRRSASEDELAALARQDGYRPLHEDGYLKASKGLTTLTEVQRVAGADTLSATG